MHVLQPKQTKLSHSEVEKLLKELNISLTQLPKMKLNDPALPEGCEIGEVMRIERHTTDGKKTNYYRVISV